MKHTALSQIDVTKHKYRSHKYVSILTTIFSNIHIHVCVKLIHQNKRERERNRTIVASPKANTTSNYMYTP